MKKELNIRPKRDRARWTEEEKHIVGRIVAHELGIGKTEEEAFEQAAFRTERSLYSIRAQWYSELKSKYNDFRYIIEYKHKARDLRYNEQKPEIDEMKEKAREVLEENEIYKRVNERQLAQIAYGLKKYPEPLNQDTWSMLETIDHIMDEFTDAMHYLEMLKMKLEKEEAQ